MAEGLLVLGHVFKDSQVPAEDVCPKCGHAGIVADGCPRCRVRVSTYRIHLAALGREVPAPVPGVPKRSLLKRLFMIEPRSPAVPSGPQRSRYEQLILTRIYRELRYPETRRGIYVVLLRFDVARDGRPAMRRLAVYPSNPAVAASVQAAVSRAQPFPLPPPEGLGGKNRRVSLALTVSI